MAIYHLAAKIISRAQGKSAVASAAYRSGEKLHDARSGKDWDYGRKERVLDRGVLLPKNAPERYSDRETLWNEVEAAEKSKAAQVAREVEVALPRELNLQQQRELLHTYIKDNFTDKGMCADYAIHAPNDGNDNYHAHIMLTMRSMDEKGQWQAKQKQEYILDENGDRIPSLDKDGSVKMHHGSIRYKTRAVKTTDWDDKETLEGWRESWADHTNEAFDKYAPGTEHIDHRSNQEREIDELPTIHEGWQARQMEARGEVSERREHNRKVKAYNKSIRRAKNEQRELTKERTAARRVATDDRARITYRGGDEIPRLTDKVQPNFDMLPRLQGGVLDVDTLPRREEQRGGQWDEVSRSTAPDNLSLSDTASGDSRQRRQEGQAADDLQHAADRLNEGNAAEIAKAARAKERYAAEIDKGYQQARLRRFATFKDINSPQLREAIADRLKWYRETPRPATKGVGLAMRYLKSVVGKDPAEEYNAQLIAHNEKVTRLKAAYAEGIKNEAEGFTREKWEKGLHYTDPLYKTLQNYRIAAFKSDGFKAPSQVADMMHEIMRRGDVVSADRFNEVMAGRGLFMSTDEGGAMSVRDLFGNRWTGRSLGISADDVNGAIESNADAALSPVQRITKQLNQPHDVYIFDISTEEGQKAAYEFAKKHGAVPPGKGQKSYTRYLLGKATGVKFIKPPKAVKGALKKTPIYAAFAVTKGAKAAVSAVSVATKVVSAVGQLAKVIPVIGNLIAGAASIPDKIMNAAKKAVSALDKKVSRVAKKAATSTEKDEKEPQEQQPRQQQQQKAQQSQQNPQQETAKRAADDGHDKIPSTGLHVPPNDKEDWLLLMEAAKGQGLLADIAREKMSEKAFAREYL